MALSDLISPVSDDGQSYIYYATYFDGTSIYEYDDNQKHFNFSDIDQKKVKYFGLIGNSIKAYWDISTGIFHLGKEEYIINISDKNTGNIIPYIKTKKDLITFKDAHTDAICSGNSIKVSEMGNIIDSYFIGFKMNTESIFTQILFGIPMTRADRRPFFGVRISNKKDNNYTAELIGLNGEDENLFSRRDIDLKDGKSSAVELHFN